MVKQMSVDLKVKQNMINLAEKCKPDVTYGVDKVSGLANSTMALKSFDHDE